MSWEFVLQLIVLMMVTTLLVILLGAVLADPSKDEEKL